MGTAGFDRAEDHWPRQWAQAFVAFAAGEARPWLYQQGHALVSDRGMGRTRRLRCLWPRQFRAAISHHRGTGPGVLEPFVRRTREAETKGRSPSSFATGSTSFCSPTGRSRRRARGDPRAQRRAPRRAAARARSSANSPCGPARSSLPPAASAATRAGASELARRGWAMPPKFMVQGVPDHVDGRMLAITEAAGARLINRDRMWHYTEGIRNWNPIWPNHGIRILPGPSSLWLDATGKRLPPPLYPGFDTLGTLEYIAKIGPRTHLVRAQSGDHQVASLRFPARSRTRT